MLRSIYFKGGIEARKQKTTNWQCLCITLFYFEALAKYKAQFFARSSTFFVHVKRVSID